MELNDQVLVVDSIDSIEMIREVMTKKTGDGYQVFLCGICKMKDISYTLITFGSTMFNERKTPKIINGSSHKHSECT